MKKITILAAVVALLGSCAQNTEDTIKPNTKVEGRTIYATFDNEEEETKTYVENYKYLRWHAGDEISFFDATTHNSQYAFAGNDGDAEGEFNAVATGEGTAIATTYGVYPYNANTSISEEGVISVELPAIQAYGVNSFGKGANTMVAVGESATDDKLFFKNACGYLVVKLYNESGATVKSVVLKGNNEEKLSGAATITATHAGVPSVTMADTATTAVTIDCGEGVEIGTTAETATEFWFALPEITFEGGITIIATDTEGKEYEKTTTKPVVITRNNVQPMKALSCEFAIPNTWKIYYTASSKVEPYNKTVFGANYVSNEWDSATGKGVITFDGEVTEIGEWAFSGCLRLTSITIPESVTAIGEWSFSGCSRLERFEGKFASEDGRCLIVDGVLNSFAIGCGITEYTIPDGVTQIGKGSFSNCLMLTSITIPENITSISESAFKGCSNLKAFKGKFASEDSRCLIVNKKLVAFAPAGIVEYTIPNGVSSFESAFSRCAELQSISLSQSVSLIESTWPFDGCNNLVEIHCNRSTPPSFKYLDPYLPVSNGEFKIFVSWKHIDAYVEDYNWSKYSDYFTSPSSPQKNELWYTTIDGNAINMDYSVDSYVEIESHTYSGGMGVITFSGNLTEIHTSALDWYDMQRVSTIWIPEGVIRMGDMAFTDWGELKKVFCLAKTPPTIDYRSFNSCPTLYVSTDSLESYQNAENWSSFSSYVKYNF